MAKASSRTKKQNRIDVQNLSAKDKDFLTLDVKDSMKKYKVEKQGVYDRRFALNKKLKEAGLAIEDVLNGAQAAEPVKQAAAKKVRQTRNKKPKQEEAPVQVSEPAPMNDIVKYEKPKPVISTPIEINFENFSIKLNGVPKSISVNPDTNAIEIDL